MIFSSKRTLRVVKTLLVSTYAEMFLLIARIMALNIIVFGGSMIDIESQFQDLLASNNRNQRIKGLFFDYFYSLDSSNMSDIDNYILGWKEVAWDSIAANTQFERLMGGIRIIQYRIDKPDDCLKTLINFNETSNSSQLVYSYSQQCNPNDMISLDNLQPDSFKIKNASLCINTNCYETIKQNIYSDEGVGFTKSNPNNQIWTPQFGYYPYNAFIADVTFQNKSQFYEKLNNLVENNWFMTGKTYAVAFQINTYNIPSEIIQALTFVIQLVDNHNPIPYMNIQTLNTRTAYLLNWKIFCIVIILIDLSFLLKIVFEGSIVPKSTQVPQFVNIVIEVIFATLCLIEQAHFYQLFKNEVGNTEIGCPNYVEIGDLANNATMFFSSIPPCQPFIVLDSLIDLCKIRIFFEGLTLGFLPFNLFWLLTYTRLVKTLIKFSNMIYRTIFNVGKLLFLYWIIVLCWGAGFYKVFRHNYSSFNEYGKTIYSFLIWTLPSTNNLSWQIQANYTNIYANALQVSLLIMCRLLVFLGLLSFTIVSIHTASDYQFDFRSKKQQQQQEVLSDVSKKIDKFSKSYLNENQEGKHESNKLIAWLDKDLFTAEDMQGMEQELEKNEIKRQCFTKVVDLIQFLQFLFQIKPQLLFKSSIHFRIVMDIGPAEEKQNEYDQKVHQQQEYQNVGRLLMMLKDKGSRVPILLNFSPTYRPSDSLLITYFKLYPFLYLNQQNYQDLKDFVFTQNFKQFQKSQLIKDEPLQNSEEIEPSMEMGEDM